MTVAALVASISYLEDGVTLAFAVPFRYLAASNLVVRRVLADGSVATLAHGSAWSATPGPTDAGGTLTLVATVAGSTLLIGRATPRSQSTDYETGDRFPAETHELGLDRAMLIDQEQDVAQAEGLARSLRVPFGEVSAEIPAADLRPGKVLGFGGGGQPVVVNPGGADSALREDLAEQAGPALIGFSRDTDYAAESIGGAASHQRITVKDNPYIALGNNVDDDTIAINTAVNDGTAKIWRVPPGRYAITELVMADKIGGGLEGDGPLVSELVVIGANTGLTITNCQRPIVRSLSVRCADEPQVVTGAKGIVVNGTSGNGLFQDLWIYGLEGGGLLLDGVVGTQMSGHAVRDAYLLGNGNSQFLSKYSHDFHYENIVTGILQGIAHAAIGCEFVNSHEGDFWAGKNFNNGIGIKETDCIGNRNIGNRTEESDAEGWYSDGPSDAIYVGNTVHTNSQTLSGVSDNWYFKDFTRITFNANAIRTWNALYARYGVNFDGGIDLILGPNESRGFDTVNFGPYRVSGDVNGLYTPDTIRFALASLAAGQTRYMGAGNGSATENEVKLSMMCKEALLRWTAQFALAPGGENIVFTARKNASDTASTATATGSVFSARGYTTNPNVLFADFDSATLKAVASGGLATNSLFANMQLCPY